MSSECLPGSFTNVASRRDIFVGPLPRRRLVCNCSTCKFVLFTTRSFFDVGAREPALDFDGIVTKSQVNKLLGRVSNITHTISQWTTYSHMLQPRIQFQIDPVLQKSSAISPRDVCSASTSQWRHLIFED